jgi:hypothetical protein
MAVSFGDITGHLFEKAKRRMEDAGPSTEYIACAVGAADGHYYAAPLRDGYPTLFMGTAAIRFR